MTETLRFIYRILLSIDQLINVVLGPVLNRVFGWKFWRREQLWGFTVYRWRPDESWALFGSEDETMSSVFGKNRHHCTGCYWVCRGLHWFDRDHCIQAIEADEGLEFGKGS